MEKSAWVWRLIGIIVLLVITFLFWHLYATLVRLNREVAPDAQSAPSTAATGDPASQPTTDRTSP